MDTQNNRTSNSNDRPRPSVRTSRSADRSRPTARTARTSERGSGTSRTSSRASRPSRTSNGANSYEQPGVWQKIMNLLPDNVLVSRIIVIAAAVIVVALLVFILFNLVTCIGGAVAPKTDSSQASTATASSASAQSSSSSGSTVASTEGVESPWTDNGRFSTGDSALDNYIKTLCDENTASGATFDQAAYDTYLYVSRSDYVERENNQSPWGETWDVEYAKQYFDEGRKGNCYNFAAVTEYVLKYFGYSDAEAQPCIVKLESGAWGDHGLVFVTNKVNGAKCIVDDALSANGWMLGINDYDYDVRNIAQNATVKGNVDALDDDNNPTPIQPGELTEQSSGASANATTTNTNTDTTTTNDGANTENADDTENADETYYDDGTDTGTGNEEEAEYDGSEEA